MKITLVQSDIFWENIPRNLEYYSKKISNINDSDLIILPEMFATGFSMQPEKVAETEAGSIMQFLKEQARNTAAALATTFACKDGTQYFNRFVFVLPDGTYTAYNKRHLFGFAEEDKHYTPGNERVIIPYKGFRIMPQVCYDLRFPVWSRNRGDYDMLLYTANWPARRSNTWRILLQARAHENQAYVAGVNRVGPDGNGIDHSGSSLLVDPRGKKLIDLSDEQEQTATAAAKIDEVRSLRNKFRAAEDADDFKLLS